MLGGTLFIQVDGPAGVGKTTLIERFLRSNRTWSISAHRLVARAAASSPPEVRRFLAAGATTAGHLAAAEERTGRAFWESAVRPVEEVLVVEGAGEVSAADFVVAVVPPLSAGRPLVSRRVVEVSRVGLAGYLSLLFGESVELVEEEDPEHFAGEVVEEECIEIPDAIAEEILVAKEGGIPIRAERWCFAEGYEALSRADVVVVVIRSEAERAAAEGFTAEVRRVFKDEELAGDLLPGRWGHERRVSVFVTDLDGRDAGLRKAVQSMKRRLARLHARAHGILF